MLRVIGLTLLMCISLHGYANDAEIVKVEFTKRGDNWRVDTTIRHNDTGWEHYADAWRVIDEKGNELGKRVLFHPHENEQPFTRSLTGLEIPAGVSIVYVEAHDKVHGWNKNKVRVDLTKKSGERFTVK